MIAFKLLCVCFAVVFAAVSGGTILDCVTFNPLVPAVERYTNLTVYCILNHTCLLENNYQIRSNELYWEINSQRIPESQYTIVNESVVGVTFQPTVTSINVLNCNVDLYDHMKTTLYGMLFSLGFPPEKPENLSCICYNKDRLTCTWDPGRPTLIPTTYTLKQAWKGLDQDYNSNPNLLQYKYSSSPSDRSRGRNSALSKYDQFKKPRPRRADTRVDCKAELNNTCTLPSKDFQFYIDTTFWVVATNYLGTAESDRLKMDIVTILKPNSPSIIRAVSAIQLQKALKIEWLNPMTDLFPMKYNLRYRIKNSSDWEQVPPDDLRTHRTSYTLQDLQPYTTYVLSVRCMLGNDVGYWSDWSKDYEATTPEAVPSQAPEFWRKISEPDRSDNRTVWLMWKDLGSYANGKILGYNLILRTAKELLYNFSVSDRECNVTVPRELIRATVTAYNSYGVSPPSSLDIPAVVKQAAPNYDVKAFPKNGCLWVEWTAVLKPVTGYVIEWNGTSEGNGTSESQAGNLVWQREPSNAAGAFLRGDVKPFVLYTIKVNPLYKDGVERPRFVEAFLEEGVPKEGPIVRTKTKGKTRAVMVWKPVPREKQGGFITNYTFQYHNKTGPLTSIVLNATQLEYMMTSLTGDTVYTVWVTANTVKGGKPGPQFTFSTDKFDPGEVEAIVVSSCIGFLICLLFIGILFCNKREFIKKHIWPNVPDPSKSNIAQWSPQTPTRHDSKNHPFQDGNFTDVSVVEITADEKKSYSEQDLKSVDLMKKNTSEGLSSGIGGSSCLSSPRLSISETDEVESSQNTSSTVQYSTVIISGYRGQQPTPMIPPTFSRSESTQPLLESEEQQVLETPNQYFKQNCTQDDSAGRLQAFLQENLPPQEAPSQNQIVNGLGHEVDFADFNAGQNMGFEGQPVSSEIGTGSAEVKSYLPQTVRRGGYIPQ